MDGLRMPLPRRGARRAGRALREARQATGSRVHTAQVMTAPDEQGLVTVLVGGATKSATLGASARQVAAGDRASVVKTGGEWVITGTSTWRAAPQVADPGAVIISSAGAPTACTRANYLYDALVNEVLPRLSEQYGAVESARIVREL